MLSVMFRNKMGLQSLLAARMYGQVVSVLRILNKQIAAIS